MSHQTNTDNIYPEGALITAKENPALPLKIMKHKARIYYCTVDGHADRKPLVYFEHELISSQSRN